MFSFVKGYDVMSFLSYLYVCIDNVLVLKRKVKKGKKGKKEREGFRLPFKLSLKHVISILVWGLVNDFLFLAAKWSVGTNLFFRFSVKIFPIQHALRSSYSSWLLDRTSITCLYTKRSLDLNITLIMADVPYNKHAEKNSYIANFQ